MASFEPLLLLKSERNASSHRSEFLITVRLTIAVVCRAQVLAVSIVLAHLVDAVRSGGERRQPAKRVGSVPLQHLGALRRRLHRQLHRQPRRLHDHQGGLRSSHRHPGLEGILMTRTSVNTSRRHRSREYIYIYIYIYTINNRIVAQIWLSESPRPRLEPDICALRVRPVCHYTVSRVLFLSARQSVRSQAGLQVRNGRARKYGNEPTEQLPGHVRVYETVQQIQSRRGCEGDQRRVGEALTSLGRTVLISSSITSVRSYMRTWVRPYVRTYVRASWN